MNNNELMNLLNVVHKNDNKRRQLIIIGTLAGAAIAFSCFLYVKKKEITKKYSLLRSEHSYDRAQIVINNAQILRLNNTIKHLQAKVEIKADKPDNNFNASSDASPSS